MRRVIIGCEFSGTVRDEFAKAGWDAWSCDLLPSDKPGNHIQGDVLAVLGDGWDLGIFHPPCTYLTNSGVKHLYPDSKGVGEICGVARWLEMEKAAQFFNALRAAPIPKIAIENPTPHKYARFYIGRYQQRIQPWEFGVPETKGICLWLKNLPPLMATIIETKREPRCHKMAPGPQRAHERSRFFPLVAKAMANQWN